MSMDSIIEVFYHFNKMLIATKHIADNNFVFQQVAHLVYNIVQTSQLHFFWPMTPPPNSPDVIGEREPHWL